MYHLNKTKDAVEISIKASTSIYNSLKTSIKAQISSPPSCPYLNHHVNGLKFRKKQDACECQCKFIVEASANLGHCTFALVRESILDDPSKLQTLEHLKSLGGDIHDHRSLVNAIKQVDVVISAIGRRSSYTPIQDQVKIVAAIKEAGNIKRFISSEFGMDVDRADGAVEPAKSLLEMKSKFRQVVQEEGLPYTIVCANYFARSCLPSFNLPIFEASPKDRLLILGDGSVKGKECVRHNLSIQLVRGIGTFTIKAVDDPRTLNKILYIRPSSNMYSFNDIVSLWETNIGLPVGRIYLHDQQI